ncbi:MAG: 5-methyltetrahydropteroyltriglutamate--homocysteine S-methyltransferase [Candidatus Aureabacteria bacterium]|nr:5-methyltetrahydropteroyltriglutamate--homocysteine S-methyltransferase [Candidatus Auribacterota bacterium]
MKTYAYGFPRIGKKREFKKLIEGYWKKDLSEKDMLDGLKALESGIENTYKKDVESYPQAEFTLYDKMLDTALLYSVYTVENTAEYFDLCRGKNALKMTKWFNTNYHYLVPVLTDNFNPQLKREHLGGKEEPGSPLYLIGCFTFLKLSKGYERDKFRELLLRFAPCFREILSQFKNVHIDEPAFVMDLDMEEIDAFREFYREVIPEETNVTLMTYYDSVDFLEKLYDLPFKAIGLDFVNGKENLNIIQEKGFPDDKTLIAGIVDGRNVWRSHLEETKNIVEKLSQKVKKIHISNAGPLYHLPVSLDEEKSIPVEMRGRLSFAEERLKELSLIKKLCEGEDVKESWNSKITDFGINKNVHKRVASLDEKDFQKELSYFERNTLQRNELDLPLFPTTTIGSYPQTAEVRKMRSHFRKGDITEKEYGEYVKTEIQKLIRFQEDIGLDVLVHGEFERTDMVEFFAEKLEGILTTKNGWIISYGTRCYRPPIIYGDVSRIDPMTTEEIFYAQSLTDKPVKGMLTGPVTIIAWSFVRRDIPTYDVAFQLALCLRDEIMDYIKGGIKIVQIDEPAIREKTPIKKRKWNDYFCWAVQAFKLVSNVDPAIQIHTHMCYSEFGEILTYIKQMDFDVISIEASRSRLDILENIQKEGFNRQIGLGVWDIHSPAVPSIEFMKNVIKEACKVFQKENIWINPDCGLKTRGWEEVTLSLKNLVSAAKKIREEELAL